ncbi:MAG: hypothetical protein Q4D87_02760 [Actinomycetaceae bacterium]|nr:hypothetical protein [Actinomycetaceae bacterium]
MNTAWKRQGLATALAVLGLVMVVVGVLFATVFRPDTTVNATAPAPTTAYYSTHQGVLSLVGDEATVTATAPDDQEITMVLGRADDVKAWLQGVAYTEIVGLSSWEDLKLESFEGEDEPGETGNLADSDMWLEVKTGAGEVTWTLNEPASDQVLLTATDGVEPAPTLTLSWERDRPIAWIYVLIGVGALLIALGLALFFHRSNRGAESDKDKKEATKKRRREEFERQRRVEVPEKQTIEAKVAGRTHVLPSRRAMREARERGESTVTVGGQSFETGLIPVVKKVRDAEAEDAATSSENEKTDDSKK